MSVPAAPRSGTHVPDNERYDLEELIPGTADSVLDVGCGQGRLGAALKRRGVRRVVGIELSPGAAALAREVLDEVLELDVEQADLPLEPRSFDWIVYGDILEHLVDPWQVLRAHRELLRPGGSVVVSIPNVAFWRVVAGLARGRWEYVDAGTLEKTHLRFFSREGIEQLLRQAGYTPVRTLTTLTPGGKSWWVNRLTRRRLEHLLVWRYVVVAQP